MKKVLNQFGILKALILGLAVVMVLIAGGAHVKAANDVTTAIDVSDGAPHAAKLTENVRVQYFRFTASQAGYMRFELNRTDFSNGQEAKWEVRLKNDQFTEIDSCISTTPRTQYVVVNPGTTYYLQVESWSDAKNVGFTVTGAFTPCATAVAEPCDRSNPKNVAIAQTYVGIIDSSRDSDYFRIQAPKNGYLSMNLRRKEAATDNSPEWTFHLYDANMNELYSIYSKFKDDAHNTEDVCYALRKNQVVYVEIENNSNAVGELYTFDAQFKSCKYTEKEQNNDYSHANKIDLKKNYVGAMGESGADYFRVKAKSGGKYKVTFKLNKTVTYGYSVKVYDSSRNLVASSKKKIYKKATVKFNAKKGKKYYVVVEHADNGFFFGGRTLGTIYNLKVSK